MLNSIINFLFNKEKRQKTCYTYLGPNREYKQRVVNTRERLVLMRNEIKKPSALAKYFVDAESLFGNDRRKTIV